LLIGVNSVNFEQKGVSSSRWKEEDLIHISFVILSYFFWLK
jgi:hypothetical protein